MSDIGFMASKAGMDMAAYGSMQQVSFDNKLSLGKLILGAENFYNRPLPLTSSQHNSSLPHILIRCPVTFYGHGHIHIHSYSTWI